jgi:DNA-binding NtrC family response regulator
MKTVLVVEDERAIREGLKRLLAREGYQVMTAENGLEALDIVSSNSVDVVLCDLKMPVMGAIEVLEKVGTSCPDLPVIIVTGQATPENAQECMTKGAYDLITKPFRTGDVLSIVKRAIDKLPPPTRL